MSISEAAERASLSSKLRFFSISTAVILLCALLLCAGTLFYCFRGFDSVFGMSYLQSQALTQLGETHESVSAYSSYPSIAAQNDLENDLHEMTTLLQQFETRPQYLTDEQRLLTNAVMQTYRTLDEQMSRILAVGISDEPSQPFYQLCYETEETCYFLDIYLRQLMERTLIDSHSSYLSDLALLRCGPVLILALMALSFLLLRRLINWVIRRVVQPVLTLSRAAHLFVDQQMSIPDVVTRGNSEMELLTRAFNRMKNECHQLLVTQQEKAELARHLFEEHLQRVHTEQQLTAARFEVLRNQINPHFLFNTLELVTQTAQLECAEQTSLLVHQLSELLRYTLYNTHNIVALRVELEMLHNYMSIQRSRFRKRLGFWVDCRVDPDSVAIPAFTLQPLVENAISHGLRPKPDGGLIRVKIVQKKQMLTVFVTDNGAGMDAATLNALRARTYTPREQSSGIGVTNVAARFQMLYPDSVFHIFSLSKFGTCVTLHYPAYAPEQNDDFERGS